MSVRSEDHLTTLFSAGYIASNCKDGSSQFNYLAQGISHQVHSAEVSLVNYLENGMVVTM